jgi:hypothetical protein
MQQNQIEMAITEQDARHIVGEQFQVTMTPTPMGMVVSSQKGPFDLTQIFIPPQIMTQGAKNWALYQKQQADIQRVAQNAIKTKL